MRRMQLVSTREWMTGRVALLTVAVVCLLATPGRLPAQDAGVSGIPPGPANARGLNGSVNDPSGIGNAARVPAIAPPTITPVMPPVVSPSTSYRVPPVQRAVRSDGRDLRRPDGVARRPERPSGSKASGSTAAYKASAGDAEFCDWLSHNHRRLGILGIHALAAGDTPHRTLVR